ncbi:MAG: tRNA guanosine(34) transglycosylase Tgt [Kofleriaceae bacterium]
MPFTLLGTAPDSRARRGQLTLRGRVIETPAFMPVGTRGSVRTQQPSAVDRLGVGLILANTYHLVQQPGLEVLRRVGGLARWIGWDGAILTDSGGFQVFSLAHACTIDDRGARFRPVVDGPVVTLTPESAIAAQEIIDSDVMMVLDQCVDATSPRPLALEAMARTHAWAARSLAARTDPARAVFAIVQGAAYPDLRRHSADALLSQGGFDGYAIGGLAVGEPRQEREDITELTAALLPADRPRYLMGVGTPIDLLEGVHRGVDLFDCILPTALAQQGVAFTSAGRVELRRTAYRDDDTALDPTCPCEACARVPRSYLHHLIKTSEPVAWSLLSAHNLRFYVTLMAQIRAALDAGTFAAFYAATRPWLDADDPAHPKAAPPPAKRGRATARGAFALHPGADGKASIRHVASGEIMHSVNDPDMEAHRLYVAPSPAIAANRAGAPLVVWDVGLGAGHNAMALVAALADAPGHGPVELVSFERDLDALRLALAHPAAFPHLRHPGPHRLAAMASFAAPGLRWTLVTGDVLDHVAAQPAPDVVWWDPFSAKVDDAMWTLAAFTRLAATLTRRCELYTYSRSTAVRTALLATGFHVARGAATGPKPETTIALWQPTDEDRARFELLDGAWLAQRARSTAAYPSDATTPAARAAVDRALATHPQFASG